MKKNLAIIISLLLFILILTACNNQEAQVEQKENINDPLPIAGMGWTREASDTEVLIFNRDGHFTYYCTCGNPVDNSDICDTYTYNETDKTITLDCKGKLDEKIKLVKYDKNKLVLEFENGTREFDKIAEE